MSDMAFKALLHASSCRWKINFLLEDTESLVFAALMVEVGGGQSPLLDDGHGPGMET